MQYIFHCFGHKNIRATHHKTIEFTKDSDLSLRGTCIIGVKADFAVSDLERFSGEIKIMVEVSGLVDTFSATINPNYQDENEIVFRKSNYPSKRTLGFNLDKGANGLNRAMVQLMRNPDSKMTVTLIE